MPIIKKVEGNDSNCNNFISSKIVPEAYNLFKISPESLEKLKEDNVVVLHTNVQLVPYTTGKVVNLSMILSSRTRWGA